MSLPIRQICSHVVRSCIFHPCDWFSRCQVSRFSPLLFVPELSGLAFSTAAIIKVSSCQVPRFQSPPSNLKTQTKLRLSAASAYTASQTSVRHLHQMAPTAGNATQKLQRKGK